MKRWPRTKPEALLWLLVLLALSGYYLYSFHAQQQRIVASEKSPLGRLDIPRLQRYGKTRSPLSDWPLWNLDQGKDDQGATAGSEPKSPYGLNTFGGVQALYILKNPGMRWEFYGVFLKDGTPRAVFHNPALAPKGWIAAGLKEELVPGLRLAEITEGQVVLEETERELGKSWQLKLFAEVAPVYREDLAQGEAVR